MGLIVYTSTGKVKYPAEKQGKANARGKDLVNDGSRRLFVNVKEGYVRGWFEEKSMVQQRFFEYKGSSDSPNKLRSGLRRALEEYFDTFNVGFTDKSSNDFLKEYLEGSSTINLPHSKSAYRNEIEDAGFTFLVANSHAAALEVAREVSMSLGGISYMSVSLPELTKKRISRLEKPTDFRSVPEVMSMPVKGAQNGLKYASYIQGKNSGSNRSRSRSKRRSQAGSSGSKLNPLNWF